MSNKKTILRTLGHIFLGLFALIIAFPAFFISFLMLTHLCEGWGCAVSLVYSPLILLISFIFYALSDIFTLITRLFLGTGLIVSGLIIYFSEVKDLGSFDLILILIGLFILSLSIVPSIINYFKNKKSID